MEKILFRGNRKKSEKDGFIFLPTVLVVIFISSLICLFFAVEKIRYEIINKESVTFYKDLEIENNKLEKEDLNEID